MRIDNYTRIRTRPTVCSVKNGIKISAYESSWKRIASCATRKVPRNQKRWMVIAQGYKSAKSSTYQITSKPLVGIKYKGIVIAGVKYSIALGVWTNPF